AFRDRVESEGLSAIETTRATIACREETLGAEIRRRAILLHGSESTNWAWPESANRALERRLLLASANLPQRRMGPLLLARHRHAETILWRKQMAMIVVAGVALHPVDLAIEGIAALAVVG